MTFLKLILETKKWSFCLSSMPFQTKCVCTTSIQLRIWFSTIFGLLKFCNIYNIIRFCEEIPCRNLCNFVKVLIVMFRKSKNCKCKREILHILFSQNYAKLSSIKDELLLKFLISQNFQDGISWTSHSIASTQYAGEET